MKCWHKESEDCSNIKNKQTQIHMAALIASISVLVLGSINAPSMIHAQNTNSTLSNATTAESHTTNTTGTPLNATASSSSSSLPCLAKDTTIIVDVYNGMTRTIHFKANQTSNTVQGISVVLKC
jgi:hypothetical protein